MPINFRQHAGYVTAEDNVLQTELFHQGLNGNFHLKNLAVGL